MTSQERLPDALLQTHPDRAQLKAAELASKHQIASEKNAVALTKVIAEHGQATVDDAHAAAELEHQQAMDVTNLALQAQGQAHGQGMAEQQAEQQQAAALAAQQQNMPPDGAEQQAGEKQ